MDISQFLLALRARRKAFVMALVVTVIAAIAVALIVPKKYTAQAAVVVDTPDEQAMSPMRTAMGVRERAAYIGTQIDLIQSGRVATQVARDLKLAQNPDIREAFEDDTGGAGSIDAWIGDQLLQKLKVRNSASNLITVEYSAKNAKFAADVANGFAKAYMDVVVMLRTHPTREAAEWFDEQLKTLHTRVAQSQSKLTAYQKEKGIVGADETVDIEQARLRELSTQLLTARNAAYDAQARFRQASQLARTGGSPDALPDVMSSPAIMAVKADLARAQSLLQTASADLGPNHPVYQRYASEVKSLRAKLAHEMNKVVASLGNGVEQSRKREQELQVAYDAQRSRIMQAKDVRAQLAALTREVENSQKSYDAVLGRYMTTRIESRARPGDVTLLTPAVEPGKPTNLPLPLVGALAIVLGLMLATLLVYVLETLDRRVRSRSDLESRLAVPSLGRLSRWQPAAGRLLPAPSAAVRALPHPW